MKKFLLAVAIVIASVSFTVQAVDWPTKTIEVINPSGAGGETDIYGRLFNRYLEKEIGRTVVTINMPGGGGTISTSEVDNSRPDGYRMLVFHNGFIINNLMGLSDLNVDSFQIAAIPVIDPTQAFFVPADAPYNTAKELVQYVRDGNDVNFATEVGSFSHFQLLALEKAANIKFDIVDAGTTPEKIMAMLGGNIDVMGCAYGVMKDYIDNGDFKCIGLLSEERSPALPDVPTFKEQGFNIVFDKFFFMAFPKETPDEIVKKFSDASVKVGNNPEFKAECEGFYATSTTFTNAEATAYMNRIAASYAELAKDLK